MLGSAPKQFFLAVAAVGAQIPGADHPLLRTIETGDGDIDPNSILEAQRELAEIPAETRENLLQAMHEYMQQDVSAIRDHLSNAGKSRVHQSTDPGARKRDARIL
ncbi:hypothetical protein [Roseibium marinum]|uniref:Uncharacterized protein n=1 Tax=Roseibium marinum TaxID=281252 RepID=A0A2S3UT06_9HYPH|nr:hypothetical protein [Roseibium marinum]POF30852.1 hypothetical protein CLV41_10530 [Roseibium marinum]